jgi:phosphoenolpyruvate---glycerone phosphotransferase subunit DhaL
MKEIRFPQLSRMLHGAAKEVAAQVGLLTELDSITGDGDHGTTVARSMEVMLTALEAGPRDRLKALFESIGWQLLGVNGGATGPLLGSLFRGLAAGMDEGATIDPPTLSAMFTRAEAEVLKVSGARIGDKTLIDALVPAVEALASCASGGDIAAMLDAGATAAEKGAASTVDMVAKKGRAKHMGARSVGHKDPGATSLSLILRGFARGFAEAEEKGT